MQLDKNDVRVPQQKRSIEKKEKIIEAAYRIFNISGYFGTNTAEIAKEAGLSTGSVYAYFTDKKDILMACLNQFGDRLTEDICREIGGLSAAGDIFVIVEKVLQILGEFHKQSELYHNEVMSLRYRDEDVKNYFVNIQRTMMEAVTKAIEEHGYSFGHSREQTYLLFRMIDGIEDELAFNEHPDIDHDILIEECSRLIISMLIKKEKWQTGGIYS
jgi:AcrR family transcriptional regulator